MNKNRIHPHQSHLLQIGLGMPNVKPFSMIHFQYQHEWIRNLLGRIIPVKLMEKLVPRFDFFIGELDEMVILIN